MSTLPLPCDCLPFDTCSSSHSRWLSRHLLSFISLYNTYLIHCVLTALKQKLYRSKTVCSVLCVPGAQQSALHRWTLSISLGMLSLSCSLHSLWICLSGLKVILVLFNKLEDSGHWKPKFKGIQLSPYLLMEPSHTRGSWLIMAQLRILQLYNGAKVVHIQ